MLRYCALSAFLNFASPPSIPRRACLWSGVMDLHQDALSWNLYAYCSPQIGASISLACFFRRRNLEALKVAPQLGSLWGTPALITPSIVCHNLVLKLGVKPRTYCLQAVALSIVLLKRISARLPLTAKAISSLSHAVLTPARLYFTSSASLSL